jgi:hypothetical protein
MPLILRFLNFLPPTNHSYSIVTSSLCVERSQDSALEGPSPSFIQYFLICMIHRRGMLPIRLLELGQVSRPWLWFDPEESSR